MRVKKQVRVLIIEQTPDRIVFRTEPLTLNKTSKLDCGCLPVECKESKSPKECPNCTWNECCCWATIRARS